MRSVAFLGDSAMESMEGRYVEGMHRQLVKSSAAANMNLIRATSPALCLQPASLSVPSARARAHILTADVKQFRYLSLQ
eukprot:SAG31_NODE_1211_length_9376_cov_2.931767_6_plen_79_part_00